MNRRVVSRRAFLKTVGLAAAALPLSQLLERQVALADGHADPLRFIAVYTPHGMVREWWRPGPGFDLRFENATLRPFDDAELYGKSFRDHLVVLDGVDLSAGLESGTVAHDAPRVILTGSAAGTVHPSIDQFLAVEQELGADTRLSSLVLAVGNDGSALDSCISYARGGTRVPKLIDPSKVFHEVFGSLLGGGASEAELAARRRRGQASLDHLTAELKALESRLAAPERVKLDQHLTALRELEKRLTRVEVCRPPDEPTKLPAVRAFNGGEPYFEAITELLVDLLVQSLACDMTRFATLMLNDLSRTGVYDELPVDVHNDVAHRYAGPREQNPGDPSTWEPLAIQHRHSYGQVARLLQQLDQFSLLESSVVLVSSDMGDPALHSSRHVPTLIAAGERSGFKLGRHLRYGSEECEGCGAPGPIPNNRVLVSICQAFGVEVEHFGESPNPEIVTGAAPGLV